MRNKRILSNVTVVMPCYNEGEAISYAIKSLKSVGFKTILVVDDDSLDDTYLRAAKEDVSILKNRQKMGFNSSLLRGLYEVKTKYAFISSPCEIFEKDSLLDFIFWGINGNYSLLFSRRKKEKYFSINIAPLLRERYGINIQEPLLNVAFVNDGLLNKIKTETIGDEFILLELVRVVMKNDLKLGTYDLEELEITIKYPFFSFLKLYSLKTRLKNRKYLRSAFPKTYKESIRNKVIYGVVIAVLGYISIRLVEFVIKIISAS